MKANLAEGWPYVVWTLRNQTKGEADRLSQDSDEENEKDQKEFANGQANK